MPWNSWEVFDPKDGKPVHVTDCEATAKQIAMSNPKWDWAPKGHEATGHGGWRLWNKK